MRRPRRRVGSGHRLGRARWSIGLIALLSLGLLPAITAGEPAVAGATTVADSAATTADSAAADDSSSTSTTSTTVAPSTTTSTSTTVAPSTTTTAPGQPPTTGVPKVPTGGPPTTPAPKTPKKKTPSSTTTTAPPPDPGPILAEVHSDLAELNAISAYVGARNQVAIESSAVRAATTTVAAARAILAADQRTQNRADSVVAAAAARLRTLAIAAYMGLGYATPAAGPQGLGNQPLGTVTTPGGAQGSLAQDAEEMVNVVAVHERTALAAARTALAGRVALTKAAGGGVTRATAALARAQATLAAGQRSLLAIAQVAATSPAASTASATSGSGAIGSKTVVEAAAEGSATTGPATATATTATAITDPPTSTGPKKIPGDTSPTILGPAVLTGAELAAWFASTGHTPNITVSMADLAADYEAAGRVTGVRDDLAFAQSVIETGFFSFPSYGQLTGGDNNFAGIGACDSCTHGWSFKDAKTGVFAQMELLEAYATPGQISTPLIGSVGVGGCCPTVLTLAGTWASSLTYGVSILTVYRQMLTWVIPRRLAAVGLIPAAPTTTPPTTAAAAHAG